MDGFYLVWSPTGSAPPSQRHVSFEHAKREAERLAECAPRAEFFVLAALSRSKKVAVETEYLRNEDLNFEVPF